MAFLLAQQAACKRIQVLNGLLCGRRRAGCGFRCGRRAVGIDLHIQVQAFEGGRAFGAIVNHGEIHQLHGIDILLSDTQHAAIVGIAAFLDGKQSGGVGCAACWDLCRHERQCIG